MQGHDTSLAVTVTKSNICILIWGLQHSRVFSPLVVVIMLRGGYVFLRFPNDKPEDEGSSSPKEIGLKLAALGFWLPWLFSVPLYDTFLCSLVIWPLFLPLVLMPLVDAPVTLKSCWSADHTWHFIRSSASLGNSRCLGFFSQWSIKLLFFFLSSYWAYTILPRIISLVPHSLVHFHMFKKLCFYGNIRTYLRAGLHPAPTLVSLCPSHFFSPVLPFPVAVMLLFAGTFQNKLQTSVTMSVYISQVYSYFSIFNLTVVT